MTSWALKSLSSIDNVRFVTKTINHLYKLVSLQLEHLESGGGTAISVSGYRSLFHSNRKRVSVSYVCLVVINGLFPYTYRV